MSIGPNNPCAFPWVAKRLDGARLIEEGMSLRDYFAAAALHELPRFSFPDGSSHDEEYRTNAAKAAAKDAYAYADAMLAEREK